MALAARAGGAVARDALYASAAAARRTWQAARPLRAAYALQAPRLGRGAFARTVAFARDEREVFAAATLPFLIVLTATTLFPPLAPREKPLEPIATLAPPATTTAPAKSPSRAPLPRSVTLAEPAPITLPAVGEPREVASPPALDTVPLPEPHLASPAGSGSLGASAPEIEPIELAALPPPDEAEVAERASSARGESVCVAEASVPPAAPRSAPFGDRLAAAARAQTREFVVYDDRYRSISYPMGDVPSYFGVCTDVVVRAYRALGVDLQALVHKARAGTGDTNIDHRRTEVLRRFFARAGQSLEPTPFAEDYRPGDIVTYDRPQNTHSRSHIAIVSDVIAPSGRPMIVHNRGWGPQLEDALFVDRITGHYRYGGEAPTSTAANATRVASPLAR